MSRVSYVMMNPGGEKELTETVRGTLNALMAQLAAEALIDANDIFELVFVGNPVMHHLLLGIDPTELGGAPFALATDSAIELYGTEVGMTAVNDSARVYVLPCIAGHVGADTAGVDTSEGRICRTRLLVVDVGTNAEIAGQPPPPARLQLAHRRPSRGAAHPGQGGAWAIERVRIDRETLEPRFKIIGTDYWSDEDGFAHATRRIGVTGICGSGIIEAVGEMFLAGLVDADGVIDGSLAARTPRLVQEGRTWTYVLQAGEPEIRVTQTDIRAIQLAKAALHAGCRLLMDHLGIDKVDASISPGRSGSHIDPLYARQRLSPTVPCPRHRRQRGRYRGADSAQRLARREIEAPVRRIEKIETAIEPRFRALRRRHGHPAQDGTCPSWPRRPTCRPALAPTGEAGRRRSTTRPV